MIMNKKMIVAIAACALTFASCNSPKKADFAGMDGEWNITEVNGSKLTSTTGQTPYIGFDLKEGRVYGFSGCNFLTATIDAKTGKASFDKMGSTMMACPDMDTERKVLAALAKVKAAKKGDNGTASLVDADGKEVAKLEKRFDPMAYNALEGEWKVVKVFGQAVKVAEGNQAPSLNFDTKSNRLGGNAGCNRVMGSIEYGKNGAQSISFGQPATTRMSCPDMETERQVLAALTDAKSFGKLRNGNAGLFDANGTLVMELSKGSAANAK